MTCRDVGRLVVCCAGMAACGDRPPVPDALPVLEVSALVTEADTAFGTLNRLASDGCTIAVYDHSSRRFHLWAGGPSWRSVGVVGEGPGEIRHPMAISVASSGAVLALDWGRRRMIRIAAAGHADRDVAIGAELGRRGFVGDIIALGERGWIEAPLGGQVTGRMSITNPDSVRLLSSYDWSGALQQSWGRLLPIPLEVAHLPGAVELWQSGSAMRWGDSLIVWFNRAGLVHLYSLQHPTTEPIRSFAIDAPRDPTPVPGTHATISEEGFLRGSGPPPFVPIGGPGAVDSDGRLYLILYDPVSADDGSTWPKERLGVFDSEGRVIAQYRVPTRNTRDIEVAGDGSILLLSHPSSDDIESWALLSLRPLFPSASGGCRWPGVGAEM